MKAAAQSRATPILKKVVSQQKSSTSPSQSQPKSGLDQSDRLRNKSQGLENVGLSRWRPQSVESDFAVSPLWIPNLGPFNTGDDIAGHIEKVGEGVTDFKVGDRVGAFTK